ncbi:hypothetical protein CRE_08362 [Caenorhabditis remanei]|uniref:Uncharacterized protein n=1 Tax=Caenorhabditis remanei TaxID=31234 RepID=E3MPM7_CAERE|nr:hypothetical protein CRE_08362 [Caenorhabditis remanei]
MSSHAFSCRGWRFSCVVVHVILNDSPVNSPVLKHQLRLCCYNAMTVASDLKAMYISSYTVTSKYSINQVTHKNPVLATFPDDYFVHGS